MLIRIGLFLTLLCWASNARAYPGFVGLGYTTCATCHYHPLGGGPLTDYGRALGATEISGKLFVSKIPDETLGENSDFLGPLGDLPDWLRLAGAYRGLDLRTGLEGESTTRWINMQAEGSVILQPTEQLFAVVTAGYVPVPSSVAAAARQETSTWISREHYVAYRFTRGFGMYAGFMDPAFGLRVGDHNAYIRSRTLQNINDQTHGVMLDFAGKKWEAAIQAFMGNLNQEKPLRQKGVTGLIEFDVADRARVGVSGWASSSDFRARQMGAVQGRFHIGTGSSLIGELGVAREKPVNGEAVVGDIMLLQTMTRIQRGFWVLFTFEHYTRDFTHAGLRNYRVGPSLQWFPFQRLELRTDFVGTRTTGQSSISADVYSLQSQVHVWL